MPAMEGLPVVGLRQHHFFSHDVVMLVSRNNLARPFSRIVKVAFDQVVAVMLLIAAGSAAAGAVVPGAHGWRARPSIAIAASAPAARTFDCIKFRTMVIDADRVLRRMSWRRIRCRGRGMGKRRRSCATIRA